MQNRNLNLRSTNQRLFHKENPLPITEDQQNPRFDFKEPKRVGVNRNRSSTIEVHDAINPTPPAKECGKRVAIVDDMSQICHLCASILRLSGYDIKKLALTGKEIVNYLSRNLDVDIILLDYRLPDMNGFETAKAVRKIAPEVKIVMMTADDTVKTQAAFEELDGFLVKPISKDGLLNILHSLKV
ncbi:MAG: response regulator [Nitrososphaerales archaeon]